MNTSVRSVTGGRVGSEEEKDGEMPSSAVAYLNLCFLRKKHERGEPARGKVREMETLGYILDTAAEGNVGAAMDIALGRFQALEVSHKEGGWGNAEHLEVAPRTKYSATSEGERNAAAKLEEKKLKREKLIAKTRTGGTEGGSPGGGLSPGRGGGRRFQWVPRTRWGSWKGGGKGRGKGKKGGK